MQPCVYAYLACLGSLSLQPLCSKSPPPDGREGRIRRRARDLQWLMYELNVLTPRPGRNKLKYLIFSNLLEEVHASTEVGNLRDQAIFGLRETQEVERERGRRYSCCLPPIFALTQLILQNHQIYIKKIKLAETAKDLYLNT
ncbi:hypothetical protein ElyMa_003447800 [Elysia marginata]|uniref:SERTA domain-containing protein n=1 Tax=Elysia marginata TaxID=1093978 RepID=A0AAV4JVD1_9GAST|nr:hypothetical protein ElyMa_003447800 [Elysia marginata]